MPAREEVRMKIAVFGASGMVGSRVVAEAAARGHEVLALSRSGSAVEGATESRSGDMGDAATVSEVAAANDVVISATGPSRTGAPHEEWLAAVTTLLQNTGGTRIVFTGGAGSLSVNGIRLVDGPGFPDAYKPEALTGYEALKAFAATDPTAQPWSYISPAPEIAPGTAVADYKVELETPAGPFVSAETFAKALVDEAETGAHNGVRFTVAD